MYCIVWVLLHTFNNHCLMWILKFWFLLSKHVTILSKPRYGLQISTFGSAIWREREKNGNAFRFKFVGGLNFIVRPYCWYGQIKPVQKASKHLSANAIFKCDSINQSILNESNRIIRTLVWIHFCHLPLSSHIHDRLLD